MLREFESPGFIRAIIYVGAAAAVVVFLLGALQEPALAWRDFVSFVQ